MWPFFSKSGEKTTCDLWNPLKTWDIYSISTGEFTGPTIPPKILFNNQSSWDFGGAIIEWSYWLNWLNVSNLNYLSINQASFFKYALRWILIKTLPPKFGNLPHKVINKKNLSSLGPFWVPNLEMLWYKEPCFLPAIFWNSEPFPDSSFFLSWQPSLKSLSPNSFDSKDDNMEMGIQQFCF